MNIFGKQGEALGQTAKQFVSVLGSTGSIGQSTLEVLSLHPERFHLFAVSANTRADLLLSQCEQWQPEYAVLRSEEKAGWLEQSLREKGLQTQLLVGSEGLDFIAGHESVDIVMAAIVGAVGLQSTLSAVDAGKKVLLANKESLVMAGALFMQAVEQSAAVLLPIDSEHNAIFQCLPTNDSQLGAEQNLLRSGICKILLTGSGGPFRTLPLNQFASVKPEKACTHPNWSMGKKISVDSATMMNKGLELIEACWLFNCSPSDIEIVVHPQSVIHSMVEYIDGSVLAQMGQPDMRTPIAHALAWPVRVESGVDSLNWSQMSGLTFESPDEHRFPALRLAREAAEAGGSAPIVLNAANEVAVEAFLQTLIPFTAIIEVVQHCLEKIPFEEPMTLEAIQAIDFQTRDVANACCQTFQQLSSS
ncbi:MAG: 1-deoxy-D-xylulose-5-phosphate reductoisomerase [Pseudomonadales bacterium]|nr:1-deoxy-D-xylulose-5-phosphate reductoisomerase [Pseudomonadales bacterium]